MTRPYSIQRRILVSAAFVLIGVGVITTLVIRHQATQAADEAYDRVLGAAALSIAGTIGLQESTVSVDIPHAAFAILGTSQLNRIFYRVASPDGELITGSPILGIEIPLSTSRETSFHDSAYRGAPIRVARVARYHGGLGNGGWINIFVGETREARELLSRELALQAFLPATALSVIGFLLIFSAVRASFAPLRTLEASIRRRSPSDLAPIKRMVPAEIRTLVSAINEFMERLNSTLLGLRQVTADAAHQLRTPLTAMRALADVTLDDAPEGPLRNKIYRIRENAIAATVLANQLLVEATLLHRLKTGERERVDMVPLVEKTLRKVVAEYRYRIKIPTITAKLDDAQGALVLGDSIVITEIVRNVLENALTHGAGPIEVSLEKSDRRVVVKVADRGPGIPATIKDKVFERFVKSTRSNTGSGLGLSIARQAANASGGTIRLNEREGGGVVAEIALPELNEAASRSETELISKAILIVIALSLMVFAKPVIAQESTKIFRMLGSLPAHRVSSLVETIETTFPNLDLNYQSMPPSQIVTKISTNSPDVANTDLIMLSSPDLGVQLANEGYLFQLTDVPILADQHRGVSHWRHEVFGFFEDPAVILVRDSAVADSEMPRNRLELALMLENDVTRFEKRVGLVNIGLDSVSYALAAQDVLRSPLFWRVARAFGSSKVRIFDTNNELLDALKNDEIDLAYNVPLSEIHARNLDGIDVVFPEDYVISLPWVISIPIRSPHRTEAKKVLALILREAFEGTFSVNSDPRTSASALDLEFQDINIGPELLVFLDPIKKTVFLDSWLEMVIN